MFKMRKLAGALALVLALAQVGTSVPVQAAEVVEQTAEATPTITKGDFYFSHPVAGRVDSESVDIANIGSDNRVQFDLGLKYGYKYIPAGSETFMDIQQCPELAITTSNPEMSVDFQVDSAMLTVTLPSNVKAGDSYTVTCEAVNIVLEIDGTQYNIDPDQSTTLTINIVSTKQCYHKCGETATAGSLCDACNAGEKRTTEPRENEKYFHATHITCENCTYNMWNLSDLKPCVFNNEGKCEACGRVENLKDCLHFANCGNRTFGELCDSCGTDRKETMSRNDITHIWEAIYTCCGFKDSFEEKHEIIDGVCEWCGYEKTDSCVHAATITYLISRNENTHTKGWKCEICKTVLEDRETITEAHEYAEEGYCLGCGFLPTGGSAGGAAPEPTPEPAPSVEETISQNIAKAAEEKVKAEEAIPVTSFLSAEAVTALPTEVKGTAATEAVYNLSKITTTQGMISAVNKIVKAAPVTETVTLYSSEPFAFNAKSLAALTNANRDIVYMFNHEGHLYKITIPAGAKVDLSLATFAGPLYIGAQLGTSVLIK